MGWKRIGFQGRSDVLLQSSNVDAPVTCIEDRREGGVDDVG